MAPQDRRDLQDQLVQRAQTARLAQSARPDRQGQRAPTARPVRSGRPDRKE
jgi:hypothetical protein